MYRHLITFSTHQSMRWFVENIDWPEGILADTTDDDEAQHIATFWSTSPFGEDEQSELEEFSDIILAEFNQPEVFVIPAASGGTIIAWDTR